MPDKIIIHNLKLSCRLGISEEERKDPQEIEIDLEIARDLREAASTDDVSKTVDYTGVVAHIEHYLKNKECKLLERVAEEISAEILRQFEVDLVLIQVRKKALKQTDWMGVELIRDRKGIKPSRAVGFQSS